MLPHEYLKALKIKAGLSNKDIAQAAKQSESNTSRIITGENDNPSVLSLVPIIKTLHGSLDAMYGIKQDEDENLRSLAGALKQRVEDQHENIVSLQDALARQDDLHKQRMEDMKAAAKDRIDDFRAQLEREQDRCNTLQKELRRIRVVNTVISITASIMVILALYMVIDAMNGSWGLIRH